jgi:tRNA(Ile)-lysidine synthase
MMAWRGLTGGRRRGGDSCRRTLVAVSGGADSSGLAIALAAGLSGPETLLTIAHIIHDMRPEADALADRDAAAALADRLGLPFVEARVRARGHGGNLEASARRLRYAALTRLARQESSPFVATAHHADDQLETILMGLLRGSGPAGLAGVSQGRRLATRRMLIRPALGLSRDQLREVCSAAGWKWQDDETNADPSRVRGALRQHVIPELKALRPGLEQKAAHAATMFAELQSMLSREARRLLSSATRDRSENTLRVDRGMLRHQPRVVLGELLREAAIQLRGREGQDRLGYGKIAQVVAAVTDASTGPRVFRCPGLDVHVTAAAVELRRTE